MAALLCGGASTLIAIPASAGPEPVLDRALTPAEVAEWRIDRAVSQYGRGDFTAAVRTLGPVIDDAGTSDDIRALALFNRGAARLQLNDFADAIEDFDAAEALSFAVPAQLHLARGIAWEHLRRPDRAAQNFVEALRADPADPSVRAKVREFFYKP
jgi:Flp pilus assembly protein TadD